MKKSYSKYILFIVGILLSIFLIKTIVDLNVIPIKFIIIGIIVMVLLNALTFILIHSKKVYFNIASYILGVFIVILSLIGINYGNNTIKFFKNSFNNNSKEVNTYNVVVLNSSSYQEIDDLKGNTIGILSSDNNDEILKNIDDINVVNYDDLYELYEGLLNSKVSSILLESAYIDVLGDDYSDIDSKIRIIYSFDVVTNNETKEEDAVIEPMNIYISGSDSRTNKIANKSRSDVNMILTINPNTKKILMTSIPRDYYVMVHGQTGLKDKLTHAGIYGLDVSRETVEDLFGIDIKYSVKIGMSAVVNVVDVVGGVDIESDTAFNSSHIKGWKVVKGINHMDGEKALAYARERYAYSSGDRHRILNQQQVLEAVIKKVTSDKTILLKYDSLLNSLSDLYRTDIPSDLIEDVIKMQLDEMPEWTFESNSVSGSDASMNTHTAPNTKRYVMIPYEDDVNKATEKINSVLKGE